jgi:hypothetical protein
VIIASVVALQVVCCSNCDRVCSDWRSIRDRDYAS